jgi:hypothetical protein
MGLAQSTLSEQQTPTPVESLAKAGSIPGAITSFKISRLADQKNDGEVTFGGLDTAKFDQNTLVTFDNVNQQGFWEGAMVPTVNGQSVGLDQGRTAILDTGTTLIVAPPNDATAIHQAIQGAQSDGQGGFTVPCTLADSVALTFNNQTFDIDPRDIAFLPVDVNDPTGDCVSGISSGQIGGATEWLVGDVFLSMSFKYHFWLSPLLTLLQRMPISQLMSARTPLVLRSWSKHIVYNGRLMLTHDAVQYTVHFANIIQ